MVRRHAVSLRRASLGAALVSLMLAGAVAGGVRAQTPGGTPDEAREPTTGASREAARARFARALALFDEGRFPEALIEFRAAHQLHPDHRVLYNVGNVHEALGQPVEAVDAWARYLDEGGDTLDASRRREVETAIARQRERIGQVDVRANVEGARVVVDGVEVGTLPLAAPLRLAIGSYAIGVRAAGHEPSTRRVAVAGESAQRLDFALERSAREVGSLRVRASVPDVRVRVGDRDVGTTPFAETLAVAPGVHVVTATRAGYRPFRAEARVDHGQETEVTLALELDPDAPDEALGTLRLRLPQPPSALRLDGLAIAVDAGLARVPVGRHELVIELPDREPVRERVALDAGETLELAPSLRWTPDARRARLERARTRRRVGAATLIAGALAVGTGAVVVGWNETRRGERDSLEPAFRACSPGSGLECGLQTEQDAQRYVALDDAMRRTRMIGVGALAAGVVAAGVGAIVLARAPSERAVDDAAHRERVSLRIGVGHVAIDGRF
ncbi:MAG: PEGA domain-containing protein [Myxococcales bacterium]|nr:PEGA domain-containing protein [Myxococcales bacterium]